MYIRSVEVFFKVFDYLLLFVLKDEFIINIKCVIL